MKHILYLYFVIGAGLLVGCQKLTSLEPPNPVIGSWVLESHEIYNLPSWFEAITHTDYRITATDTIYGNSTLAQQFNVYSLTFSNSENFTEAYYKNGGLREISTTQIDSGSWTLSDSVVILAVNNLMPHKLTYSVATDRLVTDRFHQKAVLRLASGSIDTVEYNIRIWYRRAP